MKNLCKSVLGLWVIGMGLGVSAPAQAVGSNGPYYAEPSWDQKLDAATRFVVLLNWNSDAVLDRETGLVWEKSPATTTHIWGTARIECTGRTTGGRMGWRLPSVHELASLIDPSNNFPAMPAGHPFLNVQFGGAGYWSATTAVETGFPSQAWLVGFTSGTVGFNNKSQSFYAWCVRGGMNVDQ